mgnify:CR=1 FL=1
MLIYLSATISDHGSLLNALHALTNELKEEYMDYIILPITSPEKIYGDWIDVSQFDRVLSHTCSAWIVYPQPKQRELCVIRRCARY